MTPQPVTESKQWYQSKTVILNAVTMLIGVLSLLAGSSDLLDPTATKWVLFAIGALNIVIRVYFTSEPVAH